MDIIEFGWNYHYAVDRHFDLNGLRQLVPVKEKGKKYIPAEEGENVIRIVLNKEVIFEEEEVEKVIIDDLKRDKEQYSKWWTDEQAKNKKLEEELKCLKIDLEKMKKGE